MEHVTFSVLLQTVTSDRENYKDIFLQEKEDTIESDEQKGILEELMASITPSQTYFPNKVKRS